MKYKGFEIKGVVLKREVWELNAKGELQYFDYTDDREYQIDSYIAEDSDGEIVLEEPTIAKLKKAINEYLEMNQ